MGNEFPESELIRKSITIRQMDFPPDVAMTKRSLLRLFALSFGLISKKESRLTIINVLDGIFYFQISKKHSPTTSELLLHLKENEKKIDEKLLRYHLKRLIDVGLLERRKGKLSFVSDPEAEQDDLVKGFTYNVGNPLQESLGRISNALSKISDKYKNQ